MKLISKFQYQSSESKEEFLPGFTQEFPYLSGYPVLESIARPDVPWHWHKMAELFYMEQGSIEYFTPNGRLFIPEGCGGFLNVNVLHMTRLPEGEPRNLQLLHLFDPELLGGRHGSLIEQKYITPLTSSQTELFLLRPDIETEKKILDLVRDIALLEENIYGYELLVREKLTEIWLQLLMLPKPAIEKTEAEKKKHDCVKQMMSYIHEHTEEKFSITELAHSGYLSERECYRVFQECLHMTPLQYIQSFRLHHAADLLVSGNQTVTDIAHSCGFGSSSYFGKLFRRLFGLSPSEYRTKWQNLNTL